MIHLTVESASVDDTHRQAERLAAIVQPGDVLALTGHLGAGKTTFTQGFATALGVTEQVNSPTFTLIKEYEGRLPFYHMDLYRLSAEEEALELGIEEYFCGDGVSVVEWPERLGDYLPDDALHIHFAVKVDGLRRIDIKAPDGRWSERLKELSLT
ncbi:tRNA (adenosine(37)-N6)-threonylcarbamoyltransferase complex ATPase subunit type 1 TsaE [Numidum massiliense]|uniref:tRNA (adenosine(37)-N6)-threonylcarbamoyltransferase complex ATPase subunit type 1 TsaE n=1 Tax=Numidum massiliense TaxID=1522315 RepID=UPI0006D56DC5|nr:tRNA (adenosine(37)-N6)-threonylcarbamoyltransferase complex ATPase subunit type 1 TsaE [Numidum massiliense]